jgi:hypothetical protein
MRASAELLALSATASGTRTAARIIAPAVALIAATITV